MKSSLLVFDSMTVAQRAVKYLISIKVNARLEKCTSSGGCAFGARIYDTPEKACRLLSAAGIECRKIISG